MQLYTLKVKSKRFFRDMETRGWWENAVKEQCHADRACIYKVCTVSESFSVPYQLPRIILFIVKSLFLKLKVYSSSSASLKSLIKPDQSKPLITSVSSLFVERERERDSLFLTLRILAKFNVQLCRQST